MNKKKNKKFTIEITCNKCGSKNVKLNILDCYAEVKCLDCGETDEIY